MLSCFKRREREGVSRPPTPDILVGDDLVIACLRLDSNTGKKLSKSCVGCPTDSNAFAE
jgi:hypothetical protein